VVEPRNNITIVGES